MPQSDEVTALQTNFETGGISRRDFIRLNTSLLLLSATGLTACSRPDEAPDERTAFRILRADDLLALNFRLRNLRIEHRYNRPSRLVRINPDEEALLFVDFPGQHIAERAYRVTADTKDVPVAIPASALIAHPSRLVFTLPASIESVELSMDKLLDWGAWEQRQADGGSDGQTTPLADQSMIEMPYGLVLSPLESSVWSHARQPVTHAGRTELWHTSLLGIASNNQVSVRILKPDHSAEASQSRVEGSLTNANRIQLYGKTASTSTLMLSSMGGWLDLRGQWQDAKITRWEHQATAGQDQSVVIEQGEGHLYPFGHLATLMIVTERQVAASTNSDNNRSRPAAVLRKSTFLVIKEPQMRYSHELMAFQSITASVLVTPALYVPESVPALQPQLDPESQGPQEPLVMWVETRIGEPYRFRFSARDWAGGDVEFDAPAVFVSGKDTYSAAKTFYEDQAYESHRLSDLRGQAVVVARFEDADNPDHDRWGEPLGKARSPGDCQLNVLNLLFTGDETQPDEGTALFSCRTSAMEARVPALEPFLSSDLNRGWFQRNDPEDETDMAELFATAMEDRPKIPLYMSKQSDRCGGLATPSMNVDGVSRVLGPVGDRDSVSGDGKTINWDEYLDDDHSTLLGNFSLIRLLSNADGTRSSIVPRFEFTIEQKSIDIKSENVERKVDESDTDDTDSDEDDADVEDKDKTTTTYTEVGLSLIWNVPFNDGLDAGIIALQPRWDNSLDKLQMQLDIEAKSSKAINKPKAPESDVSDEKQGVEPSVSWSVSASLKNFEIQLKTSTAPLLTIGFDYLSVTLAPAQKKEENGSESDKDNGQTTNDASDSETAGTDRKKSSPSISATIDHKISGVDASGALAYLQKMLDAISHLPKPPELQNDAELPPDSSKPEEKLDYPAKLPGLGSADISVDVGPFRVPEFKWLQFEVSNVSVSVGMGFYFFARKFDNEEEPRIPDNEFSMAVAEIDKPLTLFAEPWGGFAYVGLTFSTRKITGFQASLGVLYRFKLDLKVTIATCEGSLAGVFTYINDSDGGKFSVDIVMKLSGQARVWIADVYLLIVAVGKWMDGFYAFRADVHVNIKLAFFTVPLHISFETTSGEVGGADRMARSLQDLPDDVSRLSQDEWLDYRRAFAAVV